MQISIIKAFFLASLIAHTYGVSSELSIEAELKAHFYENSLCKICQYPIDITNPEDFFHLCSRHVVHTTCAHPWKERLLDQKKACYFCSNDSLQVEKKINVIDSKEATTDPIKATFFSAAANGHSAIVATIITKVGPYLINSTNNFGYTPLLYASLKGHESVVELLLNNGADPNISTENGNHYTPLMAATEHNHIGVVKKLLAGSSTYNLKADPNLVDSHSGSSALMIAAKKNFDILTQLLLDAGANKLIKNTSSKNALDIAIDNHHRNIINILRKKVNSSVRRGLF